MTKEDREYLAEWLNRKMANDDISGGDLSRALGVSEAAVSKWRNGKGRPSLETTMRLASFLGVNGLRLSVTAGHMTPVEAGVEALPLPVETGRQAAVEAQIMRITGLTDADKEALLNTLDRRIQDDESAGDPNR
ncbi:helix-turn-helix domain-containing protein [Streptomyces sp. NPDC002754]